MYMPTHSETTTQNENSTVPVEFKKIIKDFVKDILTTFPEYTAVPLDLLNTTVSALILTGCLISLLSAIA